MDDFVPFAAVLDQLVQMTGYTPGQLSERAGIPKNTVVNWLHGRVRRPRHESDIHKLAAAMRLTAVQTNALLDAAGYPPLPPNAPQMTAEWEPPFQAIPRLPYFVGRQAELAQLQQWLTEATPLPVVITGMAGIGKTAVAAELASTLRPVFVEGVLWAGLNAADPMSVLRSFAEAFGRDVSEYHDEESRSRMVRSLLQSRRCLIILDNVETAAQVRPLLPPTGQCAVLITTRRQDLLLLGGARRLKLAPFAADGPEVRTLFSQMIGAARVTDQETAVDQIARRLGCHPLALAISAGRIAAENWPVTDFLQRLQAEEMLLELTADGADLSRLFDLSFARLTGEQRRLLLALSTMGGDDADVTAVAAVAEMPKGAAAAGLRQLVVLSMVQAGAADRFGLHPLLRHYARSQIQTPDMWRRMVVHYVTLAQSKGRELPLMAREQSHILAALQTAVTFQIDDWLVRGVTAVVPFLIMQGDYEVAQVHLKEGLAAAVRRDDQTAQASLTLYLAQIARQRQALDTAVTHLQAVAALISREPTPYLQTAVLTEQGIVAACQNEFDRAHGLLSQALIVARQHQYDDLLLSILEELGIAAVQKGDRMAAASYYQEGITIANRRRQRPQTVLMLKSLGSLHYLEGDKTAAAACFQAGWDLAQVMNYRKGMAYLLNNRAVMAAAATHFDAAAGMLQTAAKLAQELADPSLQKMVDRNQKQLSRLQAGADPDEERLKLFI